jgi:primosomal protein DnaI
MEKARKTIREIILKDKSIKDFIKNNKIPEDIVEKNLSLLYSHKVTNDTCLSCLGKKNCEVDPDLLQSELEYKNGMISRSFSKCQHNEHINDDLLELMFFPKNYIDGDLFTDRIGRKGVYLKLGDITRGNNNKGLYIHGLFGTGKTFILLKTAQQLSKKGNTVIFAYYPDLVRHVKSCITDNKIEPIVNKLKNVDVLMLDDIGGENNTSFIRDEILGPILQYRMLGNKLTFMTSNANIDMLRTHFMETKDNVDRLKADRIIERIVFMMDVVEIKDINLRRSNEHVKE